ncbi:MAG: GNAT family N-acetyltransferase [Bacteroidetes bacterium]|nr:GNAT family N-acetyltransferase [Bacteroidota bacterium]
MNFLPIRPTLEENSRLLLNPYCTDVVNMCIAFYGKVGYQPPWICYLVEEEGQMVATAGIKGKPVDGKVEIAYGTVDEFQHRGIATRVCSKLVEVCIEADPDVTVTARTLKEENYSTRVLRKNSFRFAGTVMDAEDGEVWEWIYEKAPKT